MNRHTIAEYLAQAERHVAKARAVTARQRKMVAQLEHDRRDTGLAKQLLDTFIGIEEAHIADRDRLRRDLAAARD